MALAKTAYYLAKANATLIPFPPAKAGDNSKLLTCLIVDNLEKNWIHLSNVFSI